MAPQEQLPNSQEFPETILVVDDNPEALKFVTRTLGANYNVISASDGIDALLPALDYGLKYTVF
jgi:CheY-like chemotaxis protein